MCSLLEWVTYPNMDVRMQRDFMSLIPIADPRGRVPCMEWLHVCSHKREWNRQLESRKLATVVCGSGAAALQGLVKLPCLPYIPCLFIYPAAILYLVTV